MTTTRLGRKAVCWYDEGARSWVEFEVLGAHLIMRALAKSPGYSIRGLDCIDKVCEAMEAVHKVEIEHTDVKAAYRAYRQAVRRTRGKATEGRALIGQSRH